MGETEDSEALHRGREATEGRGADKSWNPTLLVHRGWGWGWGYGQLLLEAVDVVMPPVSWPGVLAMPSRRDAPNTCGHAGLRRSPDRQALAHVLRRAQWPSDSPYAKRHACHRDMPDMFKRAMIYPDTQGRLRVHAHAPAHSESMPMWPPCPSGWTDGARREGGYKLNIETAIHSPAASLPGGCGPTGWRRGQGKSGSLN